MIGQCLCDYRVPICPVLRLFPARQRSSGQARAELAGRPATWLEPAAAGWDPRGKVHPGAEAAWKGHRWKIEPPNGKPVERPCIDGLTGHWSRCCQASGPEQWVYFWLSGGVLGGIRPLRDASVVAPTRIHPYRPASLRNWENIGGVEFGADF